MTKSQDWQTRLGKLVSIDTAAELLAVSPATIRSWIAQKRLTKLKVGACVRLREVEVLALIKPA